VSVLLLLLLLLPLAPSPPLVLRLCGPKVGPLPLRPSSHGMHHSVAAVVPTLVGCGAATPARGRGASMGDRSTALGGASKRAGG
jgi:hypothetical protein